MTGGERTIRLAHASGQLARAATQIVELYGDEIYRFLCSLLPEPAAADDAFSRWCESLWIGLPGFQWESSARVWAYALARLAWTRALRERRRDRVAGITLSEVESLVAAADAVRARTESFLKTDAKDALGAAGADLSDDDRQLLMLRVTRKMSWLEIAHVLCEPGDELSELRRKRRAAALRKRYERLKNRLRERIDGTGA